MLTEVQPINCTHTELTRNKPGPQTHLPELATKGRMQVVQTVLLEQVSQLVIALLQARQVPFN